MIESYAIGAIGVAALAGAWLGVQIAWGRSFPDDSSEPDVLARRGCSGCGLRGPCEKSRPEEEDPS